MATYKYVPITDERVHLVRNELNLGVGGATMVGFDSAMSDDSSYLVKIDGDGQMDLTYLGVFRDTLSNGCDFVKGNRFYFLDDLATMPALRLIGNAFLTLLTRISTGYWSLADPTNGYIGVPKSIWKQLRRRKIQSRYFFESDMIYNLSLLNADIAEIAMPARYRGERSGLRPLCVIPSFLYRHTLNFVNRFFYVYVLRGMSPATIALPLSMVLGLGGAAFALTVWFRAIHTGMNAPTGSIVLGALCIILAFLFLLVYFIDDYGRQPSVKVIRSFDKEASDYKNVI
jgi:glycosyltransferase involved in cell wall biosynthesis